MFIAFIVGFIALEVLAVTHATKIVNEGSSSVLDLSPAWALIVLALYQIPAIGCLAAAGWLR